MASTFNKFGRLIRIVGDTSANAASAWALYKAEVAKTNSGNIVFANLTGDNGDSSVLNPAGYYLFANGIQYKVADIETLNKHYNEFTAYMTNANASISDLSTDRNELERWRGALNFALSDNKITIVDGNSTGIKGEINFSGGEYVSVTTVANTSTINASLVDSMIARATDTGRDAGNYRKIATKGYVDTSIDVVNTRIANVSTEVTNVSNRLSGVVKTIDFGAAATSNVATVTLTETTEGDTASTYSYTVTGDDYVKIGQSAANKITLAVGVNNDAIDGIAVTNTSLSGTGVIVDYVNRKVANLTGALRFKTTVDSSNNAASEETKAHSMYHILRGVDASKGNLWVANASFNYTEPSTGAKKYGKKVVVESGDYVLIIADATTTIPADFEIIERNLDGAVTAGTDILTADQVVIGNGNQTVKHSGYTLGGNTSDGYAGSDNKLSTEKAAKEYVEGRIDALNVISNSSSNYLNTSAAIDRNTDTVTITTGVNVNTFTGTTASETAGAELADAATFKQAITDREGTLVVSSSDTAVSADSSIIIALQSTNNNTSISLHGGDYIQLEKVNDKSISIAVKTSDLSTADTNEKGVALAADVSAKIIDVEQVVAAAVDTLKQSIGFTDNLTPNWGTDTAAAYGQNSSVSKVIDTMNSSLTNVSTQLNARIDNLNVANTEATGKILVGISQAKGVVNSSNATLTINGVDFTHVVESGTVEATIDGEDIKVGGSDTKWKDVSVNKAIVDLSTAIDGVSGNFLKEVHGETALTPDSSHKAIDSYVAVYAAPTADNSTYLNSSVLVTNHPTVQSSGYSPASDTGLATDGYVIDYIHSLLEWETLS